MSHTKALLLGSQLGSEFDNFLRFSAISTLIVVKSKIAFLLLVNFHNFVATEWTFADLEQLHFFASSMESRTFVYVWSDCFFFCIDYVADYVWTIAVDIYIRSNQADKFWITSPVFVKHRRSCHRPKWKSSGESIERAISAQRFC